MASPGKEWIFISYRRKDTGGYALALYKDLTRDYGSDAVFFDEKKIDAGADFPDRLKAAMDAALVVMAVIGPDWLKEINKRSKKVDELDFVRLELAQALTQKPDGTKRCVVPLLMGEAKAVAAKALAVTLRQELGELTRKNAVELRGATWDAGYKRLSEQINPIRLARAGGTADHAAMAVAIAKRLRATLARADMHVLAALWDLHEANGVFTRSAESMLVELSGAVQTITTTWRDDPSTAPTAAIRERMARDCRELAMEVLKLGVDPAAARQWVQSGESVPCNTVGMATLVRAIAVGEALVADPVSLNDDFSPERCFALDAALDSGAAVKQRAQVGRGLWPHAFLKPPIGDMNDKACANLAIRIKHLTERDKRSFVVTAPIDDPSYRSELTDLARPFNAIGLGRQTAATQTILREPEAELISAVCLCLEEIENLT